jgi:dihydroorotase
MNMDLLIKNVNLIDYKREEWGDIYIEKGKIKEIGGNIDKSCKIIDGEGLYLLPSFIDTHAHFRDPGFTYKEDLESGSKAANRGGYTGVNLMANTMPVISSMDRALDVIKRGKEIGKVDIHQCISITKDFDGKDLSQLEKIEDPVKIISEDGFDVESAAIMYKAMKIAHDKNLIVMCHSEDKSLAGINSRLSENINVIRNIQIAKETNCRLHLAHVSTFGAMEYIISEKKKGTNITCEVMPHHIGLKNLDYKVNPPIRESDDVIFLKNAVKDGFVDTIGTDHAPHSFEDKLKGANGISGIETAFCVCYTNLIKEGYITLNKLSELMSKNGADLLSMNKGRLEAGYDGDLVLIDINKEITVDAEKFYSKGKNTPFDGMKYYGDIICTIKGGKIVYDNR